MRKLHLVGLTTDRDGLIFTARKGSKSGGYIVPLDKKVLAAIAAASERDNGEPEASRAVAAGEVEAVPRRLRSESALTPREMQARLRAGRTIDEVAAEAGVDHEWVARFAVPILAEQAQVVELARGLVYAKPRLGESTETLGSSVMMNLSDRGVFLPDDVANAAWSAFQLHDSVWMVRFRYHSRGRDQEAQWEIDVPTGRLRARNRQASDLGYIGPDRWLTAEDLEDQPPEEEPAPPARASRRRVAPAPAPARNGARAKKAPAKRTPAKRTPAKRTPAKAAATPPPRRRATAVPAPARKSTAKPAPAAKKPVARKAATRSAPRPAAAKSTTRRRPTKAVPAPEAGPAVGSGGVRMAVAQVSTARVAASMASAEREPWAAAVRAGAGGRRPTVKQAAPRDRGVQARPTVAPFQPRPLPPPGSEPPAPRIRKITVQSRPGDGSPPDVSLPAPRRAAQDTEVLPGAERPKRRRLRSR